MNSLDKFISDLLAEKDAPKARPSPWRAEYISLHTTTQHCSNCGHEETHTSSEPLVTFTNIRTGTLWHVASHPSVHNTQLPRRILRSSEELEVCHKCFQAPSAQHTQLLLQLTSQPISAATLNAQIAERRGGASI